MVCLDLLAELQVPARLQTRYRAASTVFPQGPAQTLAEPDLSGICRCTRGLTSSSQRCKPDPDPEEWACPLRAKDLILWGHSFTLYSSRRGCHSVGKKVTLPRLSEATGGTVPHSPIPPSSKMPVGRNESGMGGWDPGPSSANFPKTMTQKLPQLGNLLLPKLAQTTGCKASSPWERLCVQKEQRSSAGEDIHRNAC